MKRIGRLSIVAALLLPAVPAPAQSGHDGVNFVQAIRERNNAVALEIVGATPNIVNSRDTKGDTALLVAVGRSDDAWTPFLLNNGADPNLAARNGDTPLIVAARVGFDAAVEWLLSMGAKVDAENRMGETALIAAVQQRRVSAVKQLLAKGANPDKPDSAAGYSARDYAKRDTRSPQILRLIEAAKPANPGKL